MNIWILTIGGSDVQLKPGNKWTDLFRTARSQVDGRGFSPPKEPIEGRFPVHARVLGVVYNQPQAEQHFDDLVFPLIDNFIVQIKDKLIEKIILVLSDQSVFTKAERSSQQHAYWQDTCILQPILEKHLRHRLTEGSPNLTIQPVLLKPTSSTEGLDDWDSVLKLVQHEFSKLEFPNDATIYVSHQAGTPAISSAVQFCSLARFGDRVKFLVSNEYNQELTDILPSSNYLVALKQQQAVKLLEQYDYSAVKDIYSEYLSADKNILLEAAIQWNYAKFEEFVNELQHLSEQTLAKEAKDRSQQWWWTAYEAAWLGVVRLNQGNTVEAMFHSFRSLEGLAIEYASTKGLRRYGRKVFEYFRSQNQRQWREHPFISTLVDLDSQTNDPTIRNDILDRRNNLFHKLSGFTPNDIFEAWGATEDNWHNVLIECLNLISSQSFISLQETSLMAKVHKKLKSAIANPQLPSAIASL